VFLVIYCTVSRLDRIGVAHIKLLYIHSFHMSVHGWCAVLHCTDIYCYILAHIAHSAGPAAISNATVAVLELLCRNVLLATCTAVNIIIFLMHTM